MYFLKTTLQEIKSFFVPLLILLLLKDFFIGVIIKKITILSFLKGEIKTILKQGIGLFLAILFYRLFGKFVLGIFILVGYLIIILLSNFYRGSEEDKIEGINLMIVMFGVWIILICIS